MKNLFFLLLLALVGLGSCTQENRTEETSSRQAGARAVGTSPSGSLDRSQVCMVNNTHMGKKQIPVAYAGKTYFGCCQMCVKRVQQDRTVRYATDPVTGREVDKAEAIITLKPGSADEVLYFESPESYHRYKKF